MALLNIPSYPNKYGIWAPIKTPQASLLRSHSPTTRFDSAGMQSTRSHSNLADLHLSFNELDFHDRTATSTPASRHKLDFMSRTNMLTPPADTNGPDLLKSRHTSRNPSRDSNIILKSQNEDDVFGGGARLQTEDRPQVAPDHGCENIVSSTDTRMTPRADRLTDPITSENAQGVLPPDALVFVANLAVHQTDEQLQESVHQAFDGFGECCVKVRRDRHKHPYALVQFYTVDAAKAAIAGSRDMFIDGRKIRTEEAQARRSVILSRLTGGAITKEEVTELFQSYGPIQEMYPTTHAEARLHGVPEGMWIKFAYYLDFKDALKVFNSTTSLYRVIEPPNLEPRIRPGPVPGGSPVMHGLRTPRSSTDQKSIFVGNLPSDVSEEELVEIFGTFGEIKGCNVIRKPITGGQGHNIFGFIEYGSTREAEAASENEIDVRGQRIRVEPKEYSARRHTRLSPYSHNQPSSAERASRTIPWGPSPGTYPPPSQFPYGFQSFYVPDIAAPYGPGMPWNSPPDSGPPRRRYNPVGQYYIASSPHGPSYAPVNDAFGMVQHRDRDRDPGAQGYSTQLWSSRTNRG